MKLFKAATTVGCMAVMGTALATGIRADDWNRKTSTPRRGARCQKREVTACDRE
jgi:hypothetical protein